MALAVGLVLSHPALAAERVVGDVHVLSDVEESVPYPEGIVVKGDRFYVSGPAIFPTAGSPPSRIGVFDVKTGALLKTLVIQGQDLAQEHALSSLTLDGEGRLYVIDTQQGVLRIDPETGAQERYAPPLAPLDKGSPMFPLPNDLTFDAKGWLYITDSFQGAIWRIPPGGGTPVVWFRAPPLAVGPMQFGPNGVRVHPHRNELWFLHTQRNVLYSLPLVEKPKASQLRQVHRFADGAGPDGVVFGKSGKLYVTLAISNQLAVLTPKGKGFTETHLGAKAPWDAPANMAFTDAGALLVTNHASLSRKAENFLVLDLFVKDAQAQSAKAK
jgi:sugar lactone lactonase YvrE